MNLFVEIVTIAILIILIKECFTIHMGLFCAYSNAPIMLVTSLYSITILNLARVEIIRYNPTHVLIISLLTIAVLVAIHIIDSLIYKKTHPRDDVRVNYSDLLSNKN